MMRQPDKHRCPPPVSRPGPDSPCVRGTGKRVCVHVAYVACHEVRTRFTRNIGALRQLKYMNAARVTLDLTRSVSANNSLIAGETRIFGRAIMAST